MDESKGKPPQLPQASKAETQSSRDKWISLILTGLGVILLLGGAIGYFVQAPAPTKTAVVPPPAGKLTTILITMSAAAPEELTRRVGGFGEVAPNLAAFSKVANTFTSAYAASPNPWSSAVSLFSSQYPSQHSVFWRNWYKSPQVSPQLAKALNQVQKATPWLPSSLIVTVKTASVGSPAIFGIQGLDRGWYAFYKGPAKRSENSELITTRALQAAISARGSNGGLIWVQWPETDRPIGPASAVAKALGEKIEKLPKTYPELDALYQKWEGGDPTLTATIEALHLSGLNAYDKQFGRFMDDLKRENIFDNAAIIVVGLSGSPAHVTDERRLAALLDPRSLKVPLLIKLPKQTSGREIAQNVSAIDVAPTIFDLYHQRVAAGFRGRSLVPLMNGNSLPEVPIRADNLTSTRQSFGVTNGKTLVVLHKTPIAGFFSREEKPGSFTHFFNLTSNADLKVNYGWSEALKKAPSLHSEGIELLKTKIWGDPSTKSTLFYAAEKANLPISNTTKSPAPKKPHHKKG